MSSDRSDDLQRHVFISYVREDRERVDRLQERIEQAGIRVWRDTADIWPGQDWKLEIRNAVLAGSLVFIACFSEHSERRGSGYQNEELILAVEQMRLRQPGMGWLIPVRFAECGIPAFDLGAGRMLASLQHVDLFGDAWEQGMLRLIGAVHRILGSSPTPGTGHGLAADDGGPSEDRASAPAKGGQVRTQAPADDAGRRQMYDRGLAALYTERWDEAAEAFLALTAGGDSYKDSALRLEQARRGQQVPALYAAACEAAESGRWAVAVERLEEVEAAEPGYRDVPRRLELVRREHARAEVADLHRAGRWHDVIQAGDRLQTLSPGDPDPDGLVASARTELAAAERARVLAETYQRALHHIGAGEWTAALMDLTFVQETDASYEQATQLADRARRELARTAPSISHPALLTNRLMTEWFTKLVFSPDDTRLALACDDDMYAAVINLDGQVQFRVRHDKSKGKYSYTSSVAFDPSGRRLLTGGPDNAARVWDAASGERLMMLAHKEAVRDVAFSPDGKLIATTCYNSFVLIWDASIGKLIDQIPRDDSGRSGSMLGDFAFSPDARKLVAAASKAVLMWDIAEGGQLLELGHPDQVEAVAYSPDGRMLATGCRDKKARIWDTASGNVFLELAHPHSVDSVAVSPDGRMLATSSQGATRIWDTTTGEKLFEANSSGNRVAFSHNGRLLAASSQQLFCLWRLQENPTL